MKQTPDMAQGKVSSVLFRLALPMMVSLFFQNLYVYVNTVYVSWLGDLPLAAVSLALPLTYLAMSLSKGIAMGAMVLMSHARGAADEAAAKRTADAMLPLMLSVMACFAFDAAASIQPLFCPDGNRAGSCRLRNRLCVLAGGRISGNGVCDGCEAVFTSRGDTVTPMKGMLWGNGVNLALDPLFIFVFGWGTTGAAAASFLSQLVCAAYLRHFLIPQTGDLVWKPQGSFLSEARIIAGQGAFVAMAYLVSPLALILLNMILIRFGPVAVGAWNLMSRTELMITLPAMGLFNALAAFTSFNLGRRDYGRIKAGLLFFLKFAWTFFAVLSFLFVEFSEAWMVLFQPAPELKALGILAMKASGIALLFMPVSMAMSGISQGLKRPLYMTMYAVVYLFLLRLPLAYWIAGHWTEKEVFWAHPAATAGAALFATAILWRMMAKCRQDISGSEAPVNTPGEDEKCLTNT
jgi:putative MATE family efflux protein